MSISRKLTRWLPARGGAKAPPAPPPAPVSAEHVDLATVFRLLRARWGTIVVVLGLFLGAGLAYSVLTPKTWRTSARILLDPRDKQIVGSDVGRQVQGMELGWVETRLELVKSYDTLAAVVKRENLVDDPEVLPPAARAAAGGDAVGAATRDLAEMVLVERPKENALIDVTVTSRSPEKAARLANAVARAFVDGLASAKVDQVEHANVLLGRQVDEMRSKMLQAEARVETYKRDHGIAMTRGNLVEEETLRQSNENLIAARLKMQETRERSERLAKLLESGDPTVLSQTDAIGSAVISRLKIEAAMASRRKTELEQTLGPRHPRVAAAAAEVERSRAQVAEEVKSLAATADLDYQVARANEDNARKALERAQARLSDASQATVGLQELENEANARRELYKTFVSRMEETTLQRNTQVSDARIVSPAQVPLRPFSPRTGLALALALVAGLGTGIGLALHRGRALLHPLHPAGAVPAAVEPPLADVAPAPLPAALATPSPLPPNDVASPPVPAASEAPAPVVAAPVEAEPLVSAPDEVEPTALAPEPVPLLAEPPVSTAVAPILPAMAEEETADLEDDRWGEIMPPDAVVAPPPEMPPHAAPEPVPPEATFAPIAPPPIPAPVAPAIAAPSETSPSETSPSEIGSPEAGRPQPRRATLAVPVDAIARLGLAGEIGGGVAALIETATGAPDDLALDRFAHLAGDLCDPAPVGVRVIFSNTVPTLLTAAVAHGLARVADASVLIDLAHEGAALDPSFEEGTPLAVDAVLDEGWERVDLGGLCLERPLDPIVAGDPTPLADLAGRLAALRARGANAVVHLGRMPTVGLLFDCAAEADHVVAVVDEKDLSGRRVGDEIAVMAGLMPHFDGVVVLTRAPEDGRLPLADTHRHAV